MFENKKKTKPHFFRKFHYHPNPKPKHFLPSPSPFVIPARLCLVKWWFRFIWVEFDLISCKETENVMDFLSSYHEDGGMAEDKWISLYVDVLNFLQYYNILILWLYRWGFRWILALLNIIHINQLSKERQ